MTHSKPGENDRLVSFLGTFRYQTTTYVFEEDEVTTEYVVRALAQMTGAREVILLCTDEAWAVHGESLELQLAEHKLPTVQRRTLPLGQNPTELWEQFQSVLDALAHPKPQARIVFDITHGFRSQPFFAAAGLDFARAIKADDALLQVVYGAFEARAGGQTPIWDLTAFVELLDWSRALLLFLRTGRVDEVAAPTERLGRELNKQWALQGRQGAQPQLRRLAEAFRRFGDALVTVRTGRLLVDGAHPSAARSLMLAIDEVGDEVKKYIPPLAQVLSMIRDMVIPLVTDKRLSQPEGQRALQALARLYFQMGRYAEAAATLREAQVTRFAGPQADCPGSDSFDSEKREGAENAWFQADPLRVKEIAELRNDIEHAGYRRHPMQPETIRTKVEQLIEQTYPYDSEQRS